VEKTAIVNLRHRKADINCCRPSIFGNPYYIGIDGDREEVLEKYRVYFEKKLTDSVFRGKIQLLRGKKLGCWCRCDPPCNDPKCKPLRCHLEVIVEYLEKI
jgi:hypothetical protein